LLDEDDNGATDLGTLEKKLAEKHQQSRQASQVASNPTSPSQATSGQDGNPSTPRSSLASPEPAKDGEKRKSLTPEKEKKGEEEEVAALSEMMCSLVTNNYGETRYIGRFPEDQGLLHLLTARRFVIWVLHLLSQGDTVGQ
jgi:hypothetical protein